MPSLGKDLSSIRAHYGYTIEDMYDATKIPLDTLRSIEDGSIFERSDEVKTYIRSFVRTYGRVLKLDDGLVVKALDQQEAGNYNGLLLKNFPELAGDLTEQKINSVNDTEGESDEKEKAADTKPKPAEEPKPAYSYKPTEKPNVRNINWADLGKRFSSNRKQTPTWLIAVIIIVVVLFVVLYFVYENGYFDLGEESLNEMPATEEQLRDQQTTSDLSLDITNAPPEEEAPEATLSDTLYLTVYAADGVLEPVRVWSDLKPRLDPYWIDQGVAMNYDFADTIRIRGQYNRMLLFLNGHIIPDFRQEHYNADENAVELTRDLFLSDPEWAAPIPMEVPENVSAPDSVANRPTFN